MKDGEFRSFGIPVNICISLALLTLLEGGSLTMPICEDTAEVQAFDKRYAPLRGRSKKLLILRNVERGKVV